MQLPLILLAFTGCEEALVRQQPPSTLTRPSPSVEIVDQVPEADGDTMRSKIAIDRAVLGERGWAVLYEGACTGADGAPQLTTILGQSELSDSTYDTAEEGARADENEGTEIIASRALRPNEPLCVALHADTGEQRDFEYEATSPFTYAGTTNLDKPLLRNDSVVAKTFHALVEPELVIQDQMLSGAELELELESVIINGPGWVSVVVGSCEDAGLDAPVRGHAFVSNGVSTQVTLRLDEPLTTSTTMCARLHHDDPADGVFSFERIPGSEPPVLISVEGEGGETVQTPVTTSFEVAFVQP